LKTIFIISDIFGRTPALDQLAQNFAVPGAQVDIVDPYKGVDQNFASQEQAYDSFMSRIGLDGYQKLIEDRLGSCEGAICLIAFSVGASAVWRLSGNPVFKHIVKAFCFYPSQIRHFPDIQPCFDTELIFPVSEPGFDVDEMSILQEVKPLVSCRKESAEHGFMNALSPGFNIDLYHINRQRIADALFHEKNSPF
jgi:dienelactone hydrolase